jgi:hypothetical protein
MVGVGPLTAMTPDWLRLLAPLPEHAIPERKPVASPDLIASGKADAIAGWQSVSINLSDPCSGLRHILITLDADGKLLSGGDSILLERQEQRGDVMVTIHDQESIGGRFEDDGSFRGTRWRTRTEKIGDADEEGQTTSTPSPPTHEETAALRRLVDDVLKRK